MEARAVNSSSTSSSATMTQPGSLSSPRATRSASTGRDISCSASMIITRSYWPDTPGPDASAAVNVTRSDKSASSALLRAAWIASVSRSKPSTLISGYACAMAMLDQPVPQARSATRADGSPRSRRSTSAIAGSHFLASRLRNTARLNSGRPSGAHGSGGGAPPPLPWAPEGRPEFNRAVFLNLLARKWLPAIADVDLRLRGEPSARVADLACGTGWSSIAMAQAYPLISVDGFDLDPDAIAAARRNGEQAGMSGQVTFAVTDASGPGLAGQYDVVTIFEALHHMSRPVDALRAARGLLRQSGSLIIADELV